MGVSIELAKCEEYIVEVDVDNDAGSIRLSVGTSFTEGGKPSVNIEIPLDYADIQEIINKLYTVSEHLTWCKGCSKLEAKCDCGDY